MAYDFDKIARTYDRLNRVMTLCLDCRWRRHAVKEVESREWRVENVLDVACGTGDMCLELLKQGYSVTGVDLSEEMMVIARRKAPEATYLIGNAESLPFEEETFDAVTCAFGVRNFVHLEKGLSEMLRVLKPGGRMVILELATPDSVVVRPFYYFYTKCIIPWLGSLIAGSREAYTYLPKSIERFPKDDVMVEIFHSVGAKEITHRKLTFGVCRLYIINKEAAGLSDPYVN